MALFHNACVKCNYIIQMAKIVITGPECSGKSFLTEKLSERLKIPYSEEYARIYLNEHGLEYTLDDIQAINQIQNHIQDKLIAHHEHVLMDTDVLTLMIWCREVFQEIPKKIMLDFERRKPDLYLLCRPDIPWEYDPQRANPHDRDRLFEIYREYLESRDIPFYIIEGNSQVRIDYATACVRQYIRLY